MSQRSGIAVFLLILSIATSPALAEKKPLWEAGAGIGVLNFPDYRGSDERSTLVLPVPYFVYRGDFLRVERNRVSGQLFESDRLELDVSLNASIPVDSDDNDARAGMPDLDPAVEIGPALEVHLVNDDSRKYTLDLRLPLRAVVTTGLDHIGWVAHPNLNLDVRNPLGWQDWRLGLLAGPMFGDRKYHDYFYGVAPEFATAQRPAYEADGGYAGSAAIGALSRRFPKFWIGGFLRLDTLSNATFEDSPLVKDRSFATAGFAITWVFKESKTLVETGPAREPEI
jgi:outer membrane scaffolding protein for murein synthesis (MipA/OmpV family)